MRAAVQAALLISRIILIVPETEIIMKNSHKDLWLEGGSSRRQFLKLAGYGTVWPNGRRHLAVF